MPQAAASYARGRKGKGAGGAGIEAPNTLQSATVVRIIDLIGEGPIGGLLNGAQSILFNGVPLMNKAGAYNFRGVTWEIRFGTPDQDPVAGFPAVETTYAIGQQIKNASPYIGPINNTNATRVAVTISLAALLVEDTNNGNINPTTVNIAIDISYDGGTTFTNIVNDVISGKTDSTYQRSYTISLAPDTGAGRYIKVYRITADPPLATIQNQTYLDAIDEIVDHALIYPNCACCALTFDSRVFGSTLPTRGYEVMGLIVGVPANYDPIGGTYATSGPGTSGGTWDGSFKPAATSNPCWQIYDLLASDRYGCGLSGATLGATYALELTKWDLYVISQYCDGLIPDGFGGMMRRYICNVALNTRAEAYSVIQAFLSVFRGMSYWGGGTVRITADMPGPVTKIVNPSNVIDGRFSIEGTALKTRHSMAIASFIDPDNQWQPTPEPVWQLDQVVTPNFGQNIAEFVAFGQTDRAHAHLAARWLLDSEQSQPDTLTYRASTDHLPGLEHLDTAPGSIIECQDPTYQGVSWSGRVISSTHDSTYTYIHVDRPLRDAQGVNITLSSSWTWLLDVEMPGYGIEGNLTIVAFTTNSDGTYTVKVAVMDIDPPPSSTWVLKSTVAGPRLFRVIAVTEPQQGLFELTGLFHDPGKYDRVELGININDNNYYSFLGGTDPINDPVAPPASVQVRDYFVGEGTTTVLRCTVSWTASTDARAVAYDVEVAGTQTGAGSSGQAYTATFTNVIGPSYDIDHVPPGNYVFAVRARTKDGIVSQWALSPEFAIDGSPLTPPAPLGLTAQGGTRLVYVTWTDVGIANLYYYEIWRAPDASGSPGTFSLLQRVSATAYTDNDAATLMPNTKWWYEVRAVTTNLALGTFASPVSATTTTLLTADLPAAIAATAAFAQSLLNAAPVLVTSLPGGPPSGTNYVVLESTNQLYYWNGSGWTATTAIIGSQGLIVAGSIEAGAISASEIAANSISAGQLASTTLLTASAQIGHLVVDTFNIAGGSASTFASASGVFSSPVSITVPVDNLDDGSADTRTGVVMCTAQNIGVGSHSVTISLNGSAIGTLAVTTGDTVSNILPLNLASSGSGGAGASTTHTLTATPSGADVLVLAALVRSV
ncbi:MAG: phage tail protein [Rhodospirillales bacterium]